MTIIKTIHGEKIPYNVKLIPKTMIAHVRYFFTDEAIIGTITEDFKYILLPDTFLSPYITEIGQVPVVKLKLNRYQQFEAKEYNEE